MTLEPCVYDLPTLRNHALKTIYIGSVITWDSTKKIKMTSQLSDDFEFSKSKVIPVIQRKFRVEWRWNHVSTTYHLCGNLNRKKNNKNQRLTLRSGAKSRAPLVLDQFEGQSHIWKLIRTFNTWSIQMTNVRLICWIFTFAVVAYVITWDL